MVIVSITGDDTVKETMITSVTWIRYKGEGLSSYYFCFDILSYLHSFHSSFILLPFALVFHIPFFPYVLSLPFLLLFHLLLLLIRLVLPSYYFLYCLFLIILVQFLVPSQPWDKLTVYHLTLPESKRYNNITNSYWRSHVYINVHRKHIKKIMKVIISVVYHLPMCCSSWCHFFNKF